MSFFPWFKAEPRNIEWTVCLSSGFFQMICWKTNTVSSHGCWTALETLVHAHTSFWDARGTCVCHEKAAGRTKTMDKLEHYIYQERFLWISYTNNLMERSPQFWLGYLVLIALEHQTPLVSQAGSDFHKHLKSKGIRHPCMAVEALFYPL